MFSTHTQRVAVLLCAWLAGCGGGGGDALDGVCRTLGGGSGVTQASVTASRINDAERAFDGSLGSFALYELLAGTGTLTLRGTAQRGIVAAGGSVAGLLLKRPSNGTSITVSINTYLEGTLQDAASAGTQSGDGSAGQTCSGVCLNPGDSAYFGIITTRPFDAIEVQLQASGVPSELQLRELCIR